MLYCLLHCLISFEVLRAFECMHMDGKLPLSTADLVAEHLIIVSVDTTDAFKSTDKHIPTNWPVLVSHMAHINLQQLMH